jgi:murein L,D-transpeptidase YcbB/YkuD
MSLARVRRSALLLPLALGIALSAPAHAGGYAAPADFKSKLVSQTSGQVASYYAYGPGPLWIDADGTLDPAADELVTLIQTAADDGLDPAALHADQLAAAVMAAKQQPTPEALAAAEAMLSRTFADYVAALRQESGANMKYEASTLQPRFNGAYFALNNAAKAPSLADYIRDMEWMHPLYGPLRWSLVNDPTVTPDARRVAIENLDRIRQIPAQPQGRHIIINAATAMLTMYDGDRLADSMRVVVGKPDPRKETPAYAGYIRTAFVNPYWNVPDDFVKSLIAKNVLEQGQAYLKRQGYEVLSGWGDDAQRLDPTKLDWRAVQRGEIFVHVRQKPGPRNSMGTIKYEFPNPYGIYLHDTPEKDLMDKDNRQLSAGCIRLEDAKKLGMWLLQTNDIDMSSDAPEQKLDLPQPVPVYVVYLTASANNGRLAIGDDPYARDRAAPAASTATSSSLALQNE